MKKPYPIDLSPNVVDGIRKFIRLMALTSNPQYAKRIRDEEDLIEAFDVVATYFLETERMVGKKIYKGQPFDVIEDVKRAVEEHYLTRRELKESALARSKNLMMYHVAVVPMIEMFAGFHHKDILKRIVPTIEQAKRMVLTMDVQSHYDDALVALAQVSEMIKQREAARKVELAKRRRGAPKRRKKKDNLTDWLEKDSSGAF